VEFVAAIWLCRYFFARSSSILGFYVFRHDWFTKLR
jgi:hypothetical protein